MKHRRYRRHTWVNPKLIAGKSKIHKTGVFTKGNVAAGEKLMEFGGALISKKEAASGKYRSRSIWPVDKTHYLALPKTDTHESLDEYLNHSCDANTWLTDEVTLAAQRDIPAGEEITLDQGTWNWEDKSYTDKQKPCSCGAVDCRKKLTAEDWKLPAVQKKYRGHFHPMIQKMIKKQAYTSA